MDWGTSSKLHALVHSWSLSQPGHQVVLGKRDAPPHTRAATDLITPLQDRWLLSEEHEGHSHSCVYLSPSQFIPLPERSIRHHFQSRSASKAVKYQLSSTAVTPRRENTSCCIIPCCCRWCHCCKFQFQTQNNVSRDPSTTMMLKDPLIGLSCHHVPNTVLKHPTITSNQDKQTSSISFFSFPPPLPAATPFQNAWCTTGAGLHFTLDWVQ